MLPLYATVGASNCNVPATPATACAAFAPVATVLAGTRHHVDDPLNRRGSRGRGNAQDAALHFDR
jgi:hypothetical protein